MHATLSALKLSDMNSGVAARELFAATGVECASLSPIDGKLLAKVRCASAADYDRVVRSAGEVFRSWRMVPAPRRGEVVRKIGLALREYKQPLGELVTLESGKILAEGLGEIQEAIDIADFAVGLSRQLYGLTMQSERPRHFMMEQWHPLGIVGVITAFNFPAAVWAWNAMLAAVCGDVVVWKPSEATPLTAIAMHTICARVAAEEGFPGIFGLVCGGRDIGERMAADERIPLISATGSCAMGRAVSQVVASRLGRSLLELGGNNAVVVLKDAELDLVVRSTVFGAVGTAGQRCTTTRRLLVDESIEGDLVARLAKAYSQVRIGNPLEQGTLMGPLINKRAVDAFLHAVALAQKQGGEVVCGGKVADAVPGGFYVQPTIIRGPRDMAIAQEETFAPILYVMKVQGIEDAIALNNSVKQGLSSAVFTRDVRAAHTFLSVAGSDCGISNVNIGTSGAEIGGAFGGEKETGGGRESGSDSWKQYMRRQTATLNFSGELPLAQGIRFDI